MEDILEERADRQLALRREIRAIAKKIDDLCGRKPYEHLLEKDRHKVAIGVLLDEVAGINVKLKIITDTLFHLTKIPKI